MYQIEADDVYEEFWEHKDKFDFSNYSKDSKYYDPTNKKVLFKFKDKAAGKIITEFVGLRSKMYSYKKIDGKSSQRAKGIVKSAIAKNLSYDKFKEVLFGKLEERTLMNILRSVNHEIKACQINKKSLSCFDHKRYLLEDGISSYAYGHKNIKIDRLQKNSKSENI